MAVVAFTRGLNHCSPVQVEGRPERLWRGLFRWLLRRLRSVIRMPRRPSSPSDRLLLRAWIEPDHEQPLRVVVRRQRGVNRLEEERAFADADGASGFVREWLLGMVRRWDREEQTDGVPARAEGKE